MTYYLIYKTTNIITNEWYTGAHKTEDKNDSYPGSGDRLKHSINKYGRKNFIKEILEEFTNEDDMYLKEDDYIDLNDPLCLNITPGGRGNSFRHINENATPEQRSEWAKKAVQTRMEKYTAEERSKWSESGNEKRRMTKSFLGKKHTEETKAKMSAVAKAYDRSGMRNGSYGSRWVNKDGIDERVSAEVFPTKLSQGYMVGRVNNLPQNKKK